MNTEDTKKYVSGAITTINNAINNINTLSSTKLEFIGNVNCYEDLPTSVKNGDVYYVTTDEKYYINTQNTWKIFSDLNISNVSGDIVNQIKTISSNLNEDINYISGIVVLSTSNLINYVDTQDQNTLFSANNYAEERINAAIEFATEGFNTEIININNQIQTVSTTITTEYQQADTNLLTTINTTSSIISTAVDTAIDKITQSIVGVFSFKGVYNDYAQLKANLTAQDGDVYQVLVVSGHIAQEDHQINPGEIEHNVEFVCKHENNIIKWIKLGSNYDFSIFALNDDVDYLSGNINTNIADINYLSGQISNNTTNISSNTANVNELIETTNDLNEQIETLQNTVSSLINQVKDLSAAIQVFKNIQ